jgi:hypothetical protein
MTTEKIRVTRQDDLDTWTPEYIIENETPHKRAEFNKILTSCGEFSDTLLRNGETDTYTIPAK